jgi:hypothetical protein
VGRLEKIRRQVTSWKERRDKWRTLSWARGVVEQLVVDAMNDRQELGFQRFAVTVSDVVLILKSQRRTLVLGTEYSGTGTDGIRSTPRVLPTVPTVNLVEQHSDWQELPSINGSVRGMDSGQWTYQLKGQEYIVNSPSWSSQWP